MSTAERLLSEAESKYELLDDKGNVVARFRTLDEAAEYLRHIKEKPH
jgi:hypothetical protein